MIAPGSRLKCYHSIPGSPGLAGHPSDLSRECSRFPWKVELHSQQAKGGDSQTNAQEGTTMKRSLSFLMIPILALWIGAFAAGTAAAGMKHQGEHSMRGTVTDIDHTTGMLSRKMRRASWTCTFRPRLSRKSRMAISLPFTWASRLGVPQRAHRRNGVARAAAPTRTALFRLFDDSVCGILGQGDDPAVYLGLPNSARLSLLPRCDGKVWVSPPRSVDCGAPGSLAGMIKAGQ